MAELTSYGDWVAAKEDLSSFELGKELSEFFHDVVGELHWFSWPFEGHWLV